MNSAPRHKIQLDFNQNTMDRLLRLKESQHGSYSDVITIALRLYDLFLTEIAAGSKIMLQRPGSEKAVEILLCPE